MKLTQELATLLDKLSDLTDAELGDLERALTASFDALDAEDKTQDSIDSMTALVAAHDRAVAELASRSMRGRLSAAPVTAASPPAVGKPSAAAFNAQAGNRPPVGSSVTGRGDLVDRYGKPIEDRRAMAEAMTASFANAKQGRGDRVPIFTAKWADAYPAERRLTGDTVSDTEKLEQQTALVASGGVCNPVSADFTIETLAIDNRPLRDGLPGFQAERGGIRYVPPVGLSSVTGGTAIWTEATDASPGTATKPFISMTCQNEVEVYVDAVPTRIRVGNFAGRFHPEAVENFVETAMAAAARVAELNLLTKISTSSTPVSSGQLLGASRDFVATLELAAAAYRYRQRCGDDHPLTVVLPSWAKAMVRADLAREAAHDDAGIDPLAVSDARIQSWFNVRSVTPIWTLDGLSAVSGGSGQVPFAAQGFGTQAAGAALLDWPHTLTWWMFASGSFQFLDGGRLDVAVVRDSALNATNDYEMFVEPFEGIAFRGLECLQVVSAIRPNGSSAATVSTQTY